jgi:hypothetical protein
MNPSKKITENNQSLALLDERIDQAELRRDYPPPGSDHSELFCSRVQDELRVLYVGRAQLLQIIQRLESQHESKFAETFRAVLETANLAGEPAANG